MNLYESFHLGNTTLKNRIVMAPMTRSRAIDNIPNDLMKTYYSQRAGAGLIISEGTSPSPNGLGYPRIPGAYTPAMVDGWAEIAKGVQANGGKFFVQLMHCGRITAKENMPENSTTLAPSAVKADGKMYTDEKGEVKHETPTAMTIEDIERAQKEFVDCSENLLRAGVDGVELHAANGYLLYQFLNPKSNLREDDYGGSFKNRARFVIETAKKVVSAVGADKVGMRFSPYGAMNDVNPYFEDLEEMYLYLASELRALDIAYVHVVDHREAMGRLILKQI
ncbi:MAG: alkene reductase [Bacteroidota bacterium]